MEAEGAPPRDIADQLAEMKARKVALRHPEGLVLGADQVLAFDGRAWGKPETQEEARTRLRMLSGQTHQLLSAAVVYEGAEPVWRHVGVARMRMRVLSDGYIADYVARNWDSIRNTPGAYLIEAEGIRLFAAIGADYHSILGLPLMQLLDWLVLSGEIDGMRASRLPG